jgi:spoIIIJ-associated protein
MKEFSNKTVEDCLADASAAFGKPAEQLIYRVTEEKKGLFSKKATIEVYDTDDAIAYAQEYLKTAIGALGIEITTEAKLEDDIIHVTINSERNPVLIGKNGRTLQAINELVRLAVSNKFRHRYRILLDVGGYKEDKYSRLAYIAKRTANDVLKTHVDVRLDPMTPDERRVIHNTLNGMANIKTESSGEGQDRAVVIKYVAGPAAPKAAEEPVEEQPLEEVVSEAPKAEEVSSPKVEETAPAEVAPEKLEDK